MKMHSITLGRFLVKDNEKIKSSEMKPDDSENKLDKRTDENGDTSIEQIDDGELPQSLKDKFKVC